MNWYCLSNNLRSEFFKSTIGVRQVDNLRPNLFNLYINDLPSYFDKTCDPVSLNSYDINCLMYDDGVVMLSSTEKGLQNCVNKLYNIATDWKMSINTRKTKILLFSKNSRLKGPEIKYNNTIIENVKQYTYLGMVFSSSGCVNLARKEIYNKGMKALFKLKQLFTPDMPGIKTVLHVFNHTVRPVLLYGSEMFFFSPSKFAENHEDFLSNQISIKDTY